ncbi:hypothetical protein FOA43_002083 [Brettanomyces nanus]|uniref:Transcription initiation factor IIF subunit beta n=1 Tax=Eeniella nana TaxID=13502 RepID=A0A875RP93_EENNA|nr:uncharacterized protein FOA43_002083 [Brettanomyces nanus]QPG74750.1 hypothetical protein FOA43_002083 [Brettanomyces nanus]
MSEIQAESDQVQVKTEPSVIADSPTEVSNSNTENLPGNDREDSPDSSIAYDEDGMPVPNGIEDVKEEDLHEGGESLNLDLSRAGNQVWLVKLTPQLADIWKNNSFLDGQDLGQIKIQKGTSPPKIFLDLNDKMPEHSNVDKEYQLRLTKQVVENEYIFNETEFDHFKHRLMYRTQVVDMPYQPKLRSMNNEALNHAATWTRRTKPSQRELPESGMGTTRIQSNRRHSRFKKFVPYAKTIPKKTQMVGKVVHECQVIPARLASNNKLKLVAQKRRLAHMVKKRRINYLKNANTGILQGRAGPNIHTGATITLSRDLAAKKEAAKSEGRASRMDKEVLMKILFDLFNKYDYWTMKGLKEKTNQPEAYLKECLENIAVMERKGPYALKYRLKEEYRKSREVERKAQQGFDLDDIDLDKRDDDDDNDDDDDDIEMEDVANI